MKLRIFKTLWGHKGDLDAAIFACVRHGFDGLEGPAPEKKPDRHAFTSKLADAGLGYIAELCSAGGYVPDRNATPAEHLRSLRRGAESAAECAPSLLSIIAGCDGWSVEQSVDFLGQAIAMAEEVGIPAAFETHRSRSLFNPWTTREILQQLPRLQLTCDYSHWCVVCERLIDTEPDVLALCASRALHVHARVGYDQGPQVPHPAAPEYRDALDAHERWWTQIWLSQCERGLKIATLTPEFGPDGYLQCQPFSRVPAANLDEVNLWMAHRQRDRFAAMFPGSHAGNLKDDVSCKPEFSG